MGGCIHQAPLRLVHCGSGGVWEGRSSGQWAGAGAAFWAGGGAAKQQAGATAATSQLHYWRSQTTVPLDRGSGQTRTRVQPHCGSRLQPQVNHRRADGRPRLPSLCIRLPHVRPRRALGVCSAVSQPGALRRQGRSGWVGGVGVEGMRYRGERARKACLLGDTVAVRQRSGAS